MSKKRIDQILLEKKLVRSRHQAAELIKNKSVCVYGKLIIKPSTEFDEDLSVDNIDIQSTELLQYVSRGGVKLQKALEKTKLEVKQKVIFDFGISTGGFTDCLLQLGAQKVVGIDVGHGQLAEKLKKDPRVVLIEGLNARFLTETDLDKALAPKRCDILVADLSFISLEQVLPQIILFLRSGGYILALVKPQFESGREWLSKGGVVKSDEAYQLVEKKIRELCLKLRVKVLDYFMSAIEGTDGNKEFFVLGIKEE